MQVYIEDIAESLDQVFNEDWMKLLNRKTGELVDVDTRHLGFAEEMVNAEDLPKEILEWEKEAVREAFNIHENWEDYISLPSQYDVHEYAIMEDFIDSLEDNQNKYKLYSAINGRKAFRRFKDMLYDLGIEQDWFDYKFLALCRIAQEWCEDNNVPFTYKEQKNRS